MLRLDDPCDGGVDLAAQRLVLRAQVEQRNLDALAQICLPSLSLQRRVRRSRATARARLGGGGWTRTTDTRLMKPLL